jgi:cytochrome P450
VNPGERVMLMWAASNHDEEEFPRPDECRLDRPSNRRLALGLENHRCFGTPTRLELRMVVEEVLRRLPDHEVTGRVKRTSGASAGSAGSPSTSLPDLLLR